MMMQPSSPFQKIRNSGKSLNVVVEDELDWEESKVEGFLECPMIDQSITITWGDESVYEVVRWFGSEMVDPTHTGLGGRWETTRVDDGGHESLIELLEDFGHSVDDPEVPDWR